MPLLLSTNGATSIPKSPFYTIPTTVVRGGGVAIFVPSDVESFEVNDVALCNTRSEQVWCNVKVNEELILVGCVYRPPYADCELNLEINKSIGFATHLRSSAPPKSLLVAGDFNFPDINWKYEGGFCTNKGRPSSLEFLNTMSKNFLTQHVFDPTFKHNILDLVVTNDPARVFRITHDPPLGSTDKDCLHATLTWSYELRSQLPSQPTSSQRQVLSLGNYNLFSEHFHEGSKLLDNDVNIAFNQVVESYNHASSVVMPTRRFSTHKRPCPKWSNDKIKHLTKSKYKLYRLVRSAPLNPELRAAYTMVCKQFKSAVRQSISKFEESIVRAFKSQPKLLFNYINSQKQC
ncbi:RNA-directed DNA polymerase from mobile element jockey-like [Brachionus plicatilis]|uniref:RNA-directed DNA polymerase from mobile element jockey-like n=1 Tax=Brachionus plicatilis TaxID=10195 RepID=A0A3M7QYJ3_BRAPC|nr:RNA-directed DNA polymerase from mobile element jockey-like [Brachionus plicatilis]